MFSRELLLKQTEHKIEWNKYYPLVAADKPIKIKEVDLRNCLKFANDSAPTTNYSGRNQTDMLKITRQALFGKIAEFGVYNSTLFNGFSKPDLAVYKGVDKSWESDLSNKKFKLAVKSWSSTQSKTVMSWVFQWKDLSGGGNDSEMFLKGSNEIICCTLVDYTEMITQVVSVFTVAEAVENKWFQEPVKESLKGIKKCIYYDWISSAKSNKIPTISDKAKELLGIKRGRDYKIETNL